MLSHGKTMMGKQKVASGFAPQDDLFAIVSLPSCFHGYGVYKILKFKLLWLKNLSF